MATRFIDKEYGVDTSTAIADDATGRAKVKNLPDAAGLVYDKVDGFIKYNDAGTIRQVVNLNEAQTLTNKTLTGAVSNAPTGTAATSVPITTRPVTAAESGTTFFLSLATGFVTTLPAPALGLHYRFLVAIAPSGGSYTIVTTGGTDLIHGAAASAADAGGSVDSTAGTAADTITFVDGQAVKGDWVEVVSDGTSWYAFGICSDEDAITFTQS